MNELKHILTKDEAANISEFIETNLFDDIRNDIDMNNINWLRTMISIYDKLKEYSGYVGLYDDISDEKGTI